MGSVLTMMSVVHDAVSFVAVGEGGTLIKYYQSKDLERRGAFFAPEKPGHARWRG